MRLARLLGLSIFGVAMIGAGCINPMAMRRAETLKPGQVEVLLAPEIFGFANLTAGVPLGPPALPSVTGSLRFGVIDRLDLQLKVDPAIIPEISVGYQIVGERPDEMKLTVTAGIKTMFAAFDLSGLGLGSAGGGVLHVPVAVLVDFPFGDENAVFVGAKVYPSATFGGLFGGIGDGSNATFFGITPGVNVGLSMKVGSLVIQPEFAIEQGFNIGDTAGLTSPAITNLQYALGIGFGGRFGGGSREPKRIE